MGGQASSPEDDREQDPDDVEEQAVSSTAPASTSAASFDPQEACRAILTDEFWQRFNQRRPLYRPGLARQFVSLLAVDELFDALVRGSSTEATSAYKHGEPCFRENIFVAYLDQCTLSLSEAEHYFPWLYELCAGCRSSRDFVSHCHGDCC
mmetsp:Transcript_25077/g.58214  ORF Transcript_25077/g.58214 Transcript_25077/m.58214 type:complete len:151 (-) Transcript_25077:146-598(-)